MNNKRSRSNWSTFILVMVITFSIVGIYWWKGEQELKVFNEHSWETAEAYFRTSYMYRERDTEYYNGNEYDTYRIYYRWEYQYEIDGNIYYCSDDEHSEEKPSSGTDYHRTILAARDDYSICLVYSNEDEVRSTVKFQTQTLPIGTVIVFGAVFILKISCRMIGRRIQRIHRDLRGNNNG